MRVSKSALLGITLFCLSALAGAESSCSDTAAPFEQLSSDELVSIAAACESEALKQLFYNRAHHQELIEETHQYSRLIPYSKRDSSQHLYGYRFYIAMIEAMAPVWYPDAKARIRFLNTEYEYCNEIVELRLQGYDNLADRLERSSS